MSNFDAQAEIARLKGELVTNRGALKRYKLMAAIFEGASQAIALINANYQILGVNPAFSNLTHYSDEDLHYFPINGMIAHHKRASLWKDIQTHLEDNRPWSGTLWNETKSGQTYCVEAVIQPLETDDPYGPKFAIYLHDITKRKQTEDELAHRRNYDLVTDLPMINALYISGQKSSQTALLFIGLDGFKTINDTLGYTIGDKLLQECAIRFNTCLGARTTVARFSGDQFTAVLPDLQDPHEVQEAAQAILDSLARPFDIENEELYMSCSIGICLWPGDGDDVETLLRNADSAMHKAKDAGRNTYHFFTPDIDAKAQAQRLLERDLRRAVRSFDDFHLVYQPIINLETNRMVGAEALIRWHSAERGLVSPAHFIPLAERNHLILPIGEWVLETACREIKEWSLHNRHPFRVSVNLSSRQFREVDLPRTVKSVLERTDFNPENLTLEITETLMMEDLDSAIEMLQQLKEMGVRLSIDDFGTGYSSLNSLKRLPLDALKIDRMFIRDLTTNKEDAAMVKAIIQMAKSSDFEVIGEGVESPKHQDFLMTNACTLAQGFYFSRPLRIEEFETFARDH